MSVKKIVILFSGEGTNMENLIRKLHQQKFDDFTVEVAAVITNKPSANGIQRAQKLGIKTMVLDHTYFDSRESFDHKLVEMIKELNVDLTVLAGFMRILTPVFTEKVTSINIHPSLLPLFKGAKALERSFASEMKIGGVTVHYVTHELDSGEIIMQGCIQKESEMDFKAYTQKIHELEYALFPKAILHILSR